MCKSSMCIVGGSPWVSPVKSREDWESSNQSANADIHCVKSIGYISRRSSRFSTSPVLLLRAYRRLTSLHRAEHWAFSSSRRFLRFTCVLLFLATSCIPGVLISENTMEKRTTLWVILVTVSMITYVSVRT